MREIVIPFALLLSLSACGGSKKKVDPKPTPSVEPTSPVVSPSEEPTSPVLSPSETVEPSSITTDVTPTVDDYGYDNYDGYYGKLTWTDGEDLKSKLHDIISKDITYVPYSSSPTNWETNQYADQSLYDHDLVDAVYGNDDEFKTATYSSGAGWQREHAFCASLMTGYDTGPAAGAGAGRAVDWHNLFASNNSGNSSRGNKNFGIADTTSPNYIISPNNYSSDERNFEPSDYDKGRLARAIFYMGVMYNEEETETIKTAVTGSQSHDGTHTFTAKYKPLTIQEEYVPYSKITIKDYFESESEDIVMMRNKYGNSDEGYANYSYENCSFAIGNLSTLLNWNELPVDHLEYQHNESVYSHVNSISGTAQGNRNPFVDYPDLVSYVYGDKQDEAGDLRYIEPTSHRLAVDSKINIHHFAIQDAIRTYEVRDTFDNSCYTLLAVYNDLSEVQALEKYDLTKPYIFTESDVGSKVVQINTVLGAISLKVNVIGSNPKNYTYYTDNDKATGGQLHTDVVGKTFTANKPVPVNVGGLTVNITTENTVTVGNSSTGGLNIGSANGVRAGKVTLTAEVEDVTAIAIEFGAGSNKNFSVSGTIGTTSIITTQTLTGKGANNMLSVNPKFETPLSGAMSITFSGLSEANSAFYLRMIAIDTK